MFETFDFLQGYSRERQYFLSLPSLWKVNFQYSREGALAPFQEGIPGSATDGPTGLHQGYFSSNAKELYFRTLFYQGQQKHSSRAQNLILVNLTLVIFLVITRHHEGVKRCY